MRDKWVVLLYLLIKALHAPQRAMLSVAVLATVATGSSAPLWQGADTIPWGQVLGPFGLVVGVVIALLTNGKLWYPKGALDEIKTAQADVNKAKDAQLQQALESSAKWEAIANRQIAANERFRGLAEGAINLASDKAKTEKAG